MKTSTIIVTVIVIVVIIAAIWGLYLYLAASGSPATYQNSGAYRQPANTAGTPAAAPNTAPGISSDAGLMSASQSLDATDMTQIDSGLNQNRSDASSF